MKSYPSDEPTILSIEDTIGCVKRKYGENWIQDAAAKCIVIWNSSAFLESHIVEKIKDPELLKLCLEYRSKKTINGHPLPERFELLAFSIFVD